MVAFARGELEASLQDTASADGGRGSGSTGRDLLEPSSTGLEPMLPRSTIAQAIPVDRISVEFAETNVLSTILPVSSTETSKKHAGPYGSASAQLVMISTARSMGTPRRTNPKVWEASGWPSTVSTLRIAEHTSTSEMSEETACAGKASEKETIIPSIQGPPIS